MVIRHTAFEDATIPSSAIGQIAVALAPDYSLAVVCYAGEIVARVYRYSGRRTSSAQLYNRLYQDFPLADFVHHVNAV